MQYELNPAIQEGGEVGLEIELFDSHGTPLALLFYAASAFRHGIPADFWQNEDLEDLSPTQRNELAADIRRNMPDVEELVWAMANQPEDL